MKLRNWFDVDKQGLAKILERKGKEFAPYELIQNAWDEPGVTKVNVLLQYKGPNMALLVVEDNAPEGFKDLSHAFTLFADSAKKLDPEKRGRFNLGEKLALAISEEVTIRTTKGGIRFDAEGRHVLRARRSAGSQVECLLRLSPDECMAIQGQVLRLIPPQGISTVINGQELVRRVPRAQIPATLPTEIANEDGLLRRVNRATAVRLHGVLTGETATLYEMGIPVVETGDRWHYDVCQKVPLTFDRENVPPAFLRQVRVAVFNHMYDQLTTADANSEWVAAVVASRDCLPQAVEAYLRNRFGEKRVSFDPSDPEANKRAVSEGYTVVTGSMMSAEAWQNAKNAGAILPAGQVTPSPKTWTDKDDPGDWIPESDWTKGMGQIAEFAMRLAERVLSRQIAVKFCATKRHGGDASYGPGGELTFNTLRLGAEWFERGVTQEVIELVIHELGHEYSGNHLSEEYHSALCRIGAKMFLLGNGGEL
jgi:hypothetical protein